MKLTNANYYTIKNKYLSNSKINDWLKDKHYFYKKHIAGQIEKKETPALRIGKAVDDYVFLGPAKFDKKYKMVSRRSKDPDPKIIELPTSEYEQVIAMGMTLLKQDAMKDVRKWYKTQQIIQVDMELGHFDGLCGIPDGYYYDENRKKCSIFDLKTAKNISPKVYDMHCEIYGYYRQAAFYSILLSTKYEIKDFAFQHLAIEKDPDGIYNCQTFELSKEKVKKEVKNIEKIIGEIMHEVNFSPKNVSWKDAIVIGGRVIEDWKEV